MSTLWSDLALARATRDHAAANGETGQSQSAANRESNAAEGRGLQRIRHILHRRLSGGLAL